MSRAQAELAHIPRRMLFLVIRMLLNAKQEPQAGPLDASRSQYPKFARKVDIPQGVGKEFVAADKAKRKRK